MPKHFNLTKIEVFSLLLIFLIYYKLKIDSTNLGFFYFAYDQGRDLLAVAKIIYEKDFVLIGPTTGLQGIFYGPWWYYFLSPILFLAKGDPQIVGIFFAFLGLLTTASFYFFLKTITKSIFLALLLSAVAVISSSWMLSPTFIWSPSLAPILLIAFILTVKKIARVQHAAYFFIMGVLSSLILNAEVAFGAMLTIWILVSPLIYKRIFFRKEFTFTLLGMFTVLSPQILFDIRNNFLITRSIVSYIQNPKVYGEEFPIFTRLVQRVDQYWVLFSQVFTGGNKLFGLCIIIAVALIFSVLIKNKKSGLVFKKDFIFIYSTGLVTFSLVFFTFFKDRVWDYYLVGMPVLFALLIAIIFSVGLTNKKLQVAIYIIGFLLIVINFPKDLFISHKVSWNEDGGLYRNEKRVMDYIVLLQPKNYSFHVYSPAIFDPPFDYLIYWYSKRGLLEKPKENQDEFYLVIRETSKKTYITSGWYQDKTRNNSKRISTLDFPGDLLVEKHMQLK